MDVLRLAFSQLPPTRSVERISIAKLEPLGSLVQLFALNPIVESGSGLTSFFQNSSRASKLVELQGQPVQLCIFLCKKMGARFLLGHVSRSVVLVREVFERTNASGEYAVESCLSIPHSANLSFLYRIHVVLSPVRNGSVKSSTLVNDSERGRQLVHFSIMPKEIDGDKVLEVICRGIEKSGPEWLNERQCRDGEVSTGGLLDQGPVASPTFTRREFFIQSALQDMVDDLVVCRSREELVKLPSYKGLPGVIRWQ